MTLGTGGSFAAQRRCAGGARRLAPGAAKLRGAMK